MGWRRKNPAIAAAPTPSALTGHHRQPAGGPRRHDTGQAGAVRRAGPTTTGLPAWPRAGPVRGSRRAGRGTRRRCRAATGASRNTRRSLSAICWYAGRPLAGSTTTRTAYSHSLHQRTYQWTPMPYVFMWQRPSPMSLRRSGPRPTAVPQVLEVCGILVERSTILHSAQVERETSMT